jgi:D-tyrosyl-tRNA(Tyr) deacylase
MRAVIQRVSSGAVSVEGQTIGAIDKGLVILVGVTQTDNSEHAHILAGKTANLRIFEDEKDKMNLSLLDVGGAALVISQFTLYADCRRGRRPGFTDAARPDHAVPIIDQFIRALKQVGVGQVATGEFGANMLVEINNQGPVTILLDTDTL